MSAISSGNQDLQTRFAKKTVEKGLGIPTSKECSLFSAVVLQGCSLMPTLPLKMKRDFHILMRHFAAGSTLTYHFTREDLAELSSNPGVREQRFLQFLKNWDRDTPRHQEECQQIIQKSYKALLPFKEKSAKAYLVAQCVENIAKIGEWVFLRTEALPASPAKVDTKGEIVKGYIALIEGFRDDFIGSLKGFPKEEMIAESIAEITRLVREAKDASSPRNFLRIIGLFHENWKEIEVSIFTELLITQNDEFVERYFRKAIRTSLGYLKAGQDLIASLAASKIERSVYSYVKIVKDRLHLASIVLNALESDDLFAKVPLPVKRFLSEHIDLPAEVIAFWDLFQTDNDAFEKERKYLAITLKSLLYKPEFFDHQATLRKLKKQKFLVTEFAKSWRIADNAMKKWAKENFCQMIEESADLSKLDALADFIVRWKKCSYEVGLKLEVCSRIKEAVDFYHVTEGDDLPTTAPFYEEQTFDSWPIDHFFTECINEVQDKKLPQVAEEATEIVELQKSAVDLDGENSVEFEKEPEVERVNLDQAAALKSVKMIEETPQELLSGNLQQIAKRLRRYGFVFTSHGRHFNFTHAETHESVAIPFHAAQDRIARGTAQSIYNRMEEILERMRS